MRTRAFLVLLLLSLSWGPAAAGDVATFQNLGFSADARYFMFAQYGVQENSSYPYADLFVVQVASNQFTQGGVRSGLYKIPIEPGNDGRGALFNLLAEAPALKSTYGVDHTRVGRLLYILLDGAEPQEELQFRDFESGKSYHIRLNQSSQGSGEQIKASFYLVVTVQQRSGDVDTFTVGLPNYWRPGVRRYRIKQVLLAPDDRSLVFVVGKEEQNGNGFNLRYMVETLRPS
jgi:predicted secreted protein